MMAEQKIFFNEPSEALTEAYLQNEKGCRVSLGKEVGSSKWYVRAIGLQGARI
jgi:hypothetical protein